MYSNSILKLTKMFNSKQTTLFVEHVNQKTSVINSSNGFINAGLKNSALTRSGNGAVKYSTTGNDFVDQFGVMGSYKQERSYSDISKDMSTLWASDPLNAVKFTVFMRTITRVVDLGDGKKTETVQRGSGLKHESIMRMIWLHVNHPDVFWKNINLFISAGSWRDVFEMLRYDLVYNGWKGRVLNWNNFGSLIMAGLENESTSELIKKYLPQIKAKSDCTTLESQANTIIGKWIANLIFGKNAYGQYRKLKSSGTAHEWQQLISKQLFDRVNFDSVHGRALALMVSGKFIANHNLESKYNSWIESKPVAKYTGYVHELMSTINRSNKPYQVKTINKQFAQLVETAKKNAKTNTSMIVVRDTSGSMSSLARGTNVSCGDIGKALALFFSEMLPDGYFANSWIEFNSDAKMHDWKGSTPVEKWMNDRSNYIGTTDFLSVIKLFARIKNSGVNESEFPTGILCISDGEFNPAQLGKTNVESARNMLRSAGFSEDYVKNFKIVLWNLQSGYYGETTGKKFETYGDVENVYYFSGYDGSIISFLTGQENKETTSTPKNAEELFASAMDQELLNMIEV